MHVVVFLFSFTVLCVICCARVFLFFVRACLYHCDMNIQLTLDAYFILTVIILFSLPILTFVQ